MAVVAKRMEGVEIDPYSWASGLREWEANGPERHPEACRFSKEPPLDNPQAAGRSSRATPILSYDTRTGKTRQYLYLLEQVSHGNSEIVAIGATTFLALERDGSFPGAGAAFKRIYKIDIRSATDVSDPDNAAEGLKVGGRTLEQVTANAADPVVALAAVGITPVSKTLVADILAEFPDYPMTSRRGWRCSETRRSPLPTTTISE